MGKRHIQAATRIERENFLFQVYYARPVVASALRSSMQAKQPSEQQKESEAAGRLSVQAKLVNTGWRTNDPVFDLLINLYLNYNTRN
jgi:hypothetical protein